MSKAHTSAPGQGHAAIMDSVYRRQRHFYDLTRKYYLFGRDTMLAQLDVPEGGRVLEVGCGTGRNLVTAARRTPHALFYGYDISSEMLASARANAGSSAAAGRIFLAQGDAENFDACSHFGVNGFDRVFMSYTVSMIPGWQQAIRHALTQLAPDGQLHLVDFGTLDGWPPAARRAMGWWLQKFHVEARANLDGTLGQLAGGASMHHVTRRIGGGYAVLATLSASPQQPQQAASATPSNNQHDWFSHAMQP